jgi:hypothetical protein
MDFIPKIDILSRYTITVAVIEVDVLGRIGDNPVEAHLVSGII